ncbi:MAG: hypothetical protein E4H09_02495 [Spirochaetales bacterium]|nr:MAG: hypothetical protein E4H09_02495 [Spirochaetales bacterium]
MKLIHRKVPQAFLEVLPEGLKFLHKHGKDYLVVEQLLCANGHSLMSPSVRIHDEPSIRIAVTRPSGSGQIFIDAFWGSHAKLYDFIPQPAEAESYGSSFAQATCPECGVSLLADRTCNRIGCDAVKSIVFHLPGKDDVIYVCARLGCPDHSIVVGGVPQAVIREVSEITYFGHGEDDQFRGI